MAEGTFVLEGGPHYFDQTQAELLDALRAERKAFFVMVAAGGGLEQPVYGFFVGGTAEELMQFLKDVIASAQAELATVQAVVGETP